MKKTPLASRFTQQLVRVNDQICFAALQQWDFAKRLEPLVVSRPKDFSTDVFPTNPYAEAIYRRVSELADMSGDAAIVALQMGVVASVEHLLAYMEEVQTFREDLIADDGDAICNDAEEEQLRLKITRWQGSEPASQYFRTLGYFRHLRNHYAHVNPKPVPAFATYIRSYGTPLNSFWNNGVTDVHGVDFKTLAGSSLTPELAFGVMNLLRVCLWHVDEMVAETLTLADAVRWIVQQIRSAPRNRIMDARRLEAKITARLRMEWNLKADARTIQQAIDEALAA